MPAAKSSVEPHVKFVLETKALMTSMLAIAGHLEVLTTSFQAVLCTSPESTEGLVSSSTQLSQSLGASTKMLQDCLSDLVTMGEAMAPVMESSPEASPALIVNLYSSLFRQLRAYYRDANDSFGQCSIVFERGRAMFFQEQFTTSTAAAAADPVKSLPNTPKEHVLEPQDPPVEATDAPTRKKKKKRRTTLEDDMSELTTGSFNDNVGKHNTHRDPRSAAQSPTDPPFSAAAPQDPKKKEEEDVVEGEEEEEEVAAVGAGQKAKRAKARKSADGRPRGVSAGTLPPSNEPAYLTVTTSVEDALGRLVRTSRPDVFSRADAFLRRPPLAVYYIRLLRPGSLALFVVKSCIDMDEYTQADLFCDVLDTDTVEAEPTESTSGEIVIDSESNLSELPVCGWRVGYNEDHTRLLYMTYVLLEQLPSSAVGRCAILQSSYVTSDGAREEVMHSVVLVSAAPEFARVSVYTLGGLTGSGGAKTDAIVALMRGSFSKSGFTEVPETDVLAAIPRDRHDSNTLLQELRSVSTSNVAPTDAFQPHVQLASLDEPAKQQRQSLTMGDVTRGMLRGGVEVLKAPLTVGRVVGGAVLDATGATGAIRNSVEGLLRRAFPHLSGEHIVESFHCAWQEGSIVKQGYLFVTLRWLCFVSTMANASFAIEYDEVKDVRKRRSSMFDNAIEVVTHINDTYFLMNFVNRDQAFAALMRQWLR